MGGEGEDPEVFLPGIGDEGGDDRRRVIGEEPDLVPLLAHLVHRREAVLSVQEFGRLPVEAHLHRLDGLDGRLQPLGGVDGRDPAMVDDGHPVAGEVRLLDVVGGEEDGDPLIGELPDHPPDDEVTLDIEARGWFVEEEEPGMAHKPHRKGEPPLHPLGEPVGEIVLPAEEVEGREELARPCVPPLLRHMIQLRGEDEVLPSGQVIVHVRGLMDDPHVPPGLDGLPDDVMPEDPGCPTGRLRDPGKDPDGGGLPRAVRPEITEDLPLGNGEGDAPEGLDLAVPFREVQHLDGRVGHESRMGLSGEKKVEGLKPGRFNGCGPTTESGSGRSQGDRGR